MRRRSARHLSRRWYRRQPRAERARNARAMYESLNAVREQLKLANAMIKKVDDKQRRADLMNELSRELEPGSD